jgi:hypothetical protein
VKDTPPAIERKYWQMLLERSGEERLKMGCSMHATSRALAVASLLQRHPGSHPAKLKRLLFLHFYGGDFNPRQRNRIASALTKSAQRSEAPQTRAGIPFELAKSETPAQIAEPSAAYRTKRRRKKRK